MPGILGMKWGEEKRRPQYKKCSTRFLTPIYTKIEERAKEEKVSIGRIIETAVSFYLLKTEKKER